MLNFDVVIIGLGPCGVSCGIYLKRYGHNVCLVGLDNTSLNKAHLIENYYGIKSISGKDLFELGISQAKELGVPVYKEEVIDIEYISDENFIVKGSTNEFNTKRILLALGSGRTGFSLANKYEGNGVSYCATCDGFLYRKKKVAIIGSSLYMKHEYDVLNNMIPNLTIFTNGEKLSFTPNSPVITEKIIEFKGNDRLEAIVTENNEYSVDGAFVALGSQNAFTFAKHLGIALDKDNYIVVDSSYMTNIKGIYAGGDAIKGLHQVATAVSDGAKCALEISKSLKK